MCSDQEWNWQPFTLRDNVQPIEPQRSGLSIISVLLLYLLSPKVGDRREDLGWKEGEVIPLLVSASHSALFLPYSSTEQLAPSAFFFPSSALLFPGHLHGDPTRISEDSVHHVLPLDV